MTLIETVAFFAANFAFIFLKAFQQRNVMGAHYVLIAMTSMFMAAVEVYVVWKIASVGPTVGAVLTLGAAGGSGACLATWLHKQAVREK